MTPAMRLLLGPSLGVLQFNYTFPIQVTDLVRFKRYGINSLMFYVVVMCPIILLVSAVFINMIIYAIRMSKPEKAMQFKLNAQGRCYTRFMEELSYIILIASMHALVNPDSSAGSYVSFILGAIFLVIYIGYVIFICCHVLLRIPDDWSP